MLFSFFTSVNIHFVTSTAKWSAWECKIVVDKSNYNCHSVEGAKWKGGHVRSDVRPKISVYKSRSREQRASARAQLIFCVGATQLEEREELGMTFLVFRRHCDEQRRARRKKFQLSSPASLYKGREKDWLSLSSARLDVGPRQLNWSWSVRFHYAHFKNVSFSRRLWVRLLFICAGERALSPCVNLTELHALRSR